MQKTFSVTPRKGKQGTFASQQQAAPAITGADFATLNKEDAAKLNISGGVVVNNTRWHYCRPDQYETWFYYYQSKRHFGKTLEEFKDVMCKQSGVTCR